MHEFYLDLHACVMHNSMCDIGIFMHSTGVFHACTMHGTGIPCIALVYSMHVPLHL